MQEKNLVNNSFYDELEALWQEGREHPIALLRAENALRNPWIEGILSQEGFAQKSLLDIGCGGGLLTNALAQKGYSVCGVDLSEKSLAFAKKKDSTGTVNYLLAAAEKLPFEESSFDIVSAMDLLEHVEDPEKVVSEASRVLKPNGLFFFHTFNRNWISYLVIIKGVEWFVRNTPEDMHLYRSFIKPEELRHFSKKQGLSMRQCIGMRPSLKSYAFWKMLLTQKVEPTFRFTFTPSLLTGYCGYCIKSP